MKEPYFRQAPEVTSRLVAGETVVLRLPDCELTILTESASVLWSAADGTRSEADLAATLAARYVLAAPPGLGDFLNDLVARRLLVVSATPSASPRPTPPAPERLGEYAAPGIRVSELVETLAGVCPTSFGGFGNCQTDGVCLTPFD